MKKTKDIVDDEVDSFSEPFTVDEKDLNSNVDLDLDSSIYQPINRNGSSVVSIEKLAEFDLHVGLRTNYWNSKMKDFIYKKKNNRHIIDIRKSIYFLDKAYYYISDLVKAGIDIMFVGVKNKNTSNIIKDAAKRVNAYYLTQRWLGGLLTNFHQINKTIKKFNQLDELINNKELSEKYTKKELIQLVKKRNKLEKFYSGIKNLTKLPSLLILFNPVEDVAAVVEARKMGIPIVALSNTNTNPDLIDFIIPGNNRSPKSVYLIANLLCDVIAEANGQETLIAHKKDDEITLPEIYATSKNTEGNNTNHERGNTMVV